MYIYIYIPLFMDGVQLPQGYAATMRNFSTNFSEIPGSH